MSAYIIRRLVLTIPTLLVVSIIIFALVRFIPGNVIDLMMAERGGQTVVGNVEQERAALEHALGLDVPAHIQYLRWIGGIILHGDLGTSLWKGSSVTQEILHRLPITFELGILALLVGLLISFPIGIYSAIRQDTGGDYLGRSFAIICIAIPSFWLATLIMVLPAVWWYWSPPMEYVPILEDTGQNLYMFIIPAAVLGMALSGVNMRMVRTMMLEVLRQDYIRTAWSKGLRERTVVLRHAMRNALIPVITIIGLQIPFLIGGTVIIEQIFCLPGIGRLLVESLNKRDYTTVSGVNMFIACWVLLTNLVVDLSYSFLDPRVRYK